MIEKQNDLGSMSISEEVIASLAGGVAAECYGIVGMASRNGLKDGIYEILKKENFARGIVVRSEDGIVIDMFVIVGYGIRISEIVIEVQKKVKYMVEQSLGINIKAINVYVQGVRAIG